MTEKVHSLSNLLIALALLQKNQRTHVNHEIMAVLEQVKKELNI